MYKLKKKRYSRWPHFRKISINVQKKMKVVIPMQMLQPITDACGYSVAVINVVRE